MREKPRKRVMGVLLWLTVACGGDGDTSWIPEANAEHETLVALGAYHQATERGVLCRGLLEVRFVRHRGQWFLETLRVLDLNIPKTEPAL